jgi:hypothetical protein
MTEYETASVPTGAKSVANGLPVERFTTRQAEPNSTLGTRTKLMQ